MMEQQFVEAVRSEIHKHFMRQRTPVRRVTRDRCIAIAAKLLGMLVERNQSSIEEIVEAAESASITRAFVDTIGCTRACCGRRPHPRSEPCRDLECAGCVWEVKHANDRVAHAKWCPHDPNIGERTAEIRRRQLATYAAASEAVVAISRCSCVCHSDDAMCQHCAETCSVGDATCKVPTPEHPTRTICHNRRPCPDHRAHVFDYPAFFRAIAREALGGGKVSGEFGEITVGCMCGRHLIGQHPFSVPHLCVEACERCKVSDPRLYDPDVHPTQYCPRCGEAVPHYTSHQIMGQGEIEGYTCIGRVPRRLNVEGAQS